MTSERLAWIERWIQQEEDELNYTPQEGELEWQDRPENTEEYLMLCAYAAEEGDR